MAEITSAAQVQTPQGVEAINLHYLALVRRRRLYGAITLLIFVLLMVNGFMVADDRNAGGFWDGLSNIGDYPGEVIAEAWQKRAELPGHMLRFLPALIETVNIAAVSTLVGAAAGLILALLSTRGLARWPRLIPVFRRLMDIMRAVPEIVIALVLIFVLGGGPVPAMIAIAIHTAGALGKLFSEVAENADLKPVEGLASTGANAASQSGQFGANAASQAGNFMTQGSAAMASGITGAANAYQNMAGNQKYFDIMTQMANRGN